MGFGDFLKLDKEQMKKDIKGRKANSPLVRSTSAHQDKTKFSKKDRKGSKQTLRKGLHEDRTLTNVRLTDHQKSVLVNIIADLKRKFRILDWV